MIQEKTLKITCHQCQQKLDVSSLEPFSRINCPRCSTELIVPEWFDSYILKEPGGSGGMASVYRAHDPALDREVAIKILNPGYCDDPARSAQFLQEARTAATVNHHAVVSIYTCGIFQGRSYIVMQYLAGGTLEEQLLKARGKLPVETVTAWIRDVAEGLECANKYGIVHHDIKPGNILLDTDGSAKIGDFGLAQMVQSTTSGKTEQSAFSRFWISPNYVSPEKVRTNEEDYRGDIYSLGATFYHLLTGSTPFSHKDMDELIRMRLTETPMQPHFLRSEINLELSQLVISMLAKNPDDRPSYRTIIGVLNRILKNHSASTVPLHVREIRTSKTPVVSCEPEDQPPALNAGQSKLKYLLMCMIFLLILLLGIFYAIRSGYFNPGVQHRSVSGEMLVMPSVSGYFATGNVEKAGLQAELVARSSKFTDKQRLLAVIQYACALYLQKTPDTEKIRSLLDEIRLQTPEDDLKSWHIPLKRLIAPEKKFLIADLEGASIPVMKLADFLILATREKNHEVVRQAFRELQTNLAGIPEYHWIRLCWEQRFSVWQHILEYGTTTAPNVEPLFRDHLKQSKVSASAPGTSQAAAGQGNNAGNSDFTPDISPAQLKTAADHYNTRQRPRPDAPCTLTRQNTQDYVNSLPENIRKFESRRLVYMCDLKSYVIRASTGNPYRVKHLVALNGKNYWNGVLLFNGKFISFKNNDGLDRMEWAQLPAKELQEILKFYVEYRKNRARHPITKEIQQEIADGYLRYALFCQWYGDYDEAKKYAVQTLKYLPGKETNKNLTQLLLR